MSNETTTIMGNGSDGQQWRWVEKLKRASHCWINLPWPPTELLLLPSFLGTIKTRRLAQVSTPNQRRKKHMLMKHRYKSSLPQSMLTLQVPPTRPNTQKQITHIASQTCLALYTSDLSPHAQLQKLTQRPTLGCEGSELHGPNHVYWSQTCSQYTLRYANE